VAKRVGSDQTADSKAPRPPARRASHKPATPPTWDLHIILSGPLAERLDAQLKRSRRTVKAEIELALERWLDRQERMAREEEEER